MGSASKTPHMQGGFASLLRRDPGAMREDSRSRVVSGGGARRAARGVPACGRPAGDVAGKRGSIRRRPDRSPDHARRAARRIAETTVVDIAAAPLAFATRLGADHVVDISDGDEALKAEAARAFDVAFEVSGTAAGLASAIGVVRRGGIVVQIGNLPGGQIPVPANAVMAKEIDLRGSFRFGPEFMTAVELIADGSVDVLSLVTAERPLVGRARRGSAGARPLAKRQGRADGD